MKTYNGPYGHTYYYKNGELFGAPSLMEGGYEEDAEIAVEDFAEPLTEEEMSEVKKNLS